MDDPASRSAKYLDLRGIPCPVNFVRCCLSLEQLKPNEFIHIDLDKGEPQEMVVPGLKEKGYVVEIIDINSSYVRLAVFCGSI